MQPRSKPVHPAHARDELHAQLAEIDENLMRSELTATEYAEHMQRRKEVWEAMREQQSGTTCSTFGNGGRGNEGFAEATAQATGKSKQDTNRATRRVKTVCQQARDIIRNTKADTGAGNPPLRRVDEAD